VEYNRTSSSASEVDESNDGVQTRSNTAQETGEKEWGMLGGDSFRVTRGSIEEKIER